MAKTFSAIMQKILVYKGDTRIGYGYIIMRPDGRTMQPTLFNDDGEALPPDWYNLVMTDEQHLVVMNRTKQ